MRTHDEVEIIFVQEIRDDVGAENVGHAAVVLRPAGDVGLRIAPEEVANESLLRHVARPANLPFAARCRGFRTRRKLHTSL